jgi:aryl-alcohol dehydrogenase-like predicted oxidoreductase
VRGLEQMLFELVAGLHPQLAEHIPLTPGSAHPPIAVTHNATPQQIALAWQLHRTVTALSIPGTTSVEHFYENLAAANISLTQDEVDAITALAPED